MKGGGKMTKGIKKPLLSKEKKQYLFFLFLSMAMALIIGAVIMIINRRNPLEGYKSLILGAFENPRKMASTMSKTIPLILTGFATAITFRAGIFNIGGEGQLYLGAFAAAYIGITFTALPGVLGKLLAIVVAALVGALFAYIPAVLRVKLGVNEVITTIMLNTVAKSFTQYLVTNPFSATDSKMAATDRIASQYQFKELVPFSNLSTTVFVSVLIALAIYLLMEKTIQGYEYKMVGENATFARYGGIKANKRMIQSMLISGALCGIVGAFEVLGVHFRFLDRISPDLFFDGMLVALVVKNSPLGIVLMGLFFGMLKSGSIHMETATGIPAELVAVIQAIIILFIAGETGFKTIYNNWKVRKNAKGKGAKNLA